MSNFSCMIMYASAWLMLLTIHLIKNRSLGLGGIILSLYFISSLFSFIFYSNTSVFDNVDFEWTAFVYLFLINAICVLPFVFYSSRLSSAKLNFSGENKFLYIFLLLCTPIVIEGFLEMFYIAINTSTSQLGSIYDSEVDTVGNQLSFIGRKTCTIARMLQYAWPILFFGCILKGGRYLKLVYIPAMGTAIRLLEGYAAAARFVIVVGIFQYLIAYLLFYPSLNVSIRKKINTIFLSFGAVLILFLSYITISRFGEMNTSVDIWTWISLYLGEGSLRFAQYIWNLNMMSDGDTCFSFFKNLIGLDTLTDNTSRREFYEFRLGIPTSIFYTMIGDFYQDFGYIGTFVIVIFIYIWLNSTLRKIVKNKSLTLNSLFVVNVFALVFLHGFMYYIFKQYILQMNLCISFIVLYFIGKSEKNHPYDIKK